MTETFAGKFWCVSNFILNQFCSAHDCLNTLSVARARWLSLDYCNFGAIVSSAVRSTLRTVYFLLNFLNFTGADSSSNRAYFRLCNSINSPIIHVRFITTSPRNTTTTHNMAQGTTSPSQTPITSRTFQARIQLQP